MNCLFCKIIEKQIPSEIVYEDESMIAFRDINPVAPEHFVFIPKKHISSLSEVAAEDIHLTGHILHQIAVFAAKKGFSNGFRVVNNTGNDGGQTVFHIHFHLLAGRKFNWPPG